MADSKIASPRAGTVSPPPNCAICLGTCTNKCFSDSCMHEFCFKCLLEWSKIKAECPLCKQAFRSIIHNIKSIDEYDEHIVENLTNEENHYLENTPLIYLPPQRPPALHQYHFRTTFTVDTHGEHAIQQMLLSHPLLTIGSFTPDRYTHHRRRRGDTSATTFRRSVYNQNLWVYAPPDITGRYRDISPSFYRNNPAARTRLVPWLNRELNALLYENTQQVMHLVDIIMDHLLRNHICSYNFRTVLFDFLGNKTDHFIHEFYNFMRSPFDMIGYDRHAIYSERRPSPIPFIDDEIDVSDYDSDVILVSDSNNNQNGRPINQEPVIIDLVETDSDEPIIVSEERNGPAIRCVEVDDNDEEEEEQRKPILPIKLRIKNKHKAKERKKGKKRHKLTSSSSSSLSPTSNDSSSDSDSEYKRYQQKKLFKKLKRRRREYYLAKIKSNSSDSESEAGNLKKKKNKSKHRSHTVTSSSRKKHHNDKVKKEKVEDEEQEKKSDSDKTRTEWRNTAESDSDRSFYSEHKPHVKSKIKDPNKSEDKLKAGPSSGRLRNTLRKETSTNLWYSRPCLYDSGSDS